MKKKPNKPPSEEYERFEKLAKHLIAVPKSEIDKRQAEYEKHKKAKRQQRKRESHEGEIQNGGNRSDLQASGSALSDKALSGR